MLRRWYVLGSLDVDGCAAVLALLATREDRVTLPEAFAAVPSGHDPELVLRQLAELDGVLFLKSEPAGLALTSDLRPKLSRLAERRDKPAAKPVEAERGAE